MAIELLQYKLLASDIDGTLVPHSYGIDGNEIDVVASINEGFDPGPVQDGFDRAINLGKYITLVTARTHPKAKSVIELLNIITPVIVNGGAQIVDPTTGTPLWESRIDGEISADIYDYIGRTVTDSSIDLLIGFGGIAEDPFKDTVRDNALGAINLDVIGISSSDEAAQLVDYANASDGAFAVAFPSPQFNATRTNVFITAKGVTKGHALSQLQSMLGIDRSETIGIGDGSNDIGLFAASGLKVAVGNASRGLKAVADIVVEPYEEYGVVTAIDRYLIG